MFIASLLSNHVRRGSTAPVIFGAACAFWSKFAGFFSLGNGVSRCGQRSKKICDSRVFVTRCRRFWAKCGWGGIKGRFFRTFLKKGVTKIGSWRLELLAGVRLRREGELLPSRVG